MAKYTRSDIEALCKRLEDRSGDFLANEQPQLSADLRAAAVIVKEALAAGLDRIEVANVH